MRDFLAAIAVYSIACGLGRYCVSHFHLDPFFAGWAFGSVAVFVRWGMRDLAGLAP